MNKHVFKKIAELEKTQLSEVKVELALVDDLKKALTSVTAYDKEIKLLSTSADKLNQIFTKAKSEKDALQKKYESNKANYSAVRKELDVLFKNLSTEAKALGIDVATIPVYKDYLKGGDQLRALYDENQTAWNGIANF